MRKSILISFIICFILFLALTSSALAAPPGPEGRLFLPLDLSEVQFPPGMGLREVAPFLRFQQRLKMEEALAFLIPLREKGLISSIQPDLSLNGILITPTDKGARAALASQMEVNEVSPDALAASQEAFYRTLKKGLRTIRASQGDTHIANGGLWTYVDIGYSCLWGTALVTNTTITAVLKNPGGEEISRGYTESDENGDWSLCLRKPRWPGYWEGRATLWPKQRLTVSTPAISQTLTIPKLTIFGDRATDVTSGKAPPRKLIWVSLNHWWLEEDGFHTDRFSEPTLTDRKGNYRVDFTSLADMRGDDWLDIDYDVGGKWLVHRWVEVSVLWGYEGQNLVGGCSKPHTLVTIALRDSKGNLKGQLSARTDAWGFLWPMEMFESDGDPAYVKPNDSLTLSGGVSLTSKVPNITAQADAATDIVSGRMPANRVGKIRLLHYTSEDPLEWDAYNAYPRANATGSYSADFSSSVDMLSYDSGDLFYPTKAGDSFYRFFVAP